MRWNVLLTVLFVSTLCCVVPATATDLTASERAGQEAYREGRFGAAVQLFTTALAETEDPTHRARLHVRIAWTQFALGRQQQASTHLKAALLEDPGLTLVPDYYTQGFLDLFARCRNQLAEQPSEGPEVPPPDLEATLAAVQSRLEDGRDLEGALADVERLISAYPEDQRLPSLRAELEQRLGLPSAQILDEQSEGPTLGDMSVPDLILQGSSSLARDDVENALRLLHEAVTRQPNNIAALELLAEAAQRARQWDEAEFALKTALSLQPTNLELRLRLGEVFLSRGDASAARDVFHKLTQDAPHADRAWAALGLIDARLGKHRDALTALARAIEENPLLPEVQLAFGELQLIAGRTESSLQALHTAANLMPDDAQVEARTGQALLALGRTDAALSHLIAAVEGGFTPGDVRRALVLAKIHAGRLAEAERDIVVIEDDLGADALLLRGFLELERERPEAAVEPLEQMVRQRPKNGPLLNLLGVALYRLTRYENASSVFQRAVQLMPGSDRVAGNVELTTTARAALELVDSASVLEPGAGAAAQ